MGLLFSRLSSFHSTDFPSEWGLQSHRLTPHRNPFVSIQLISPASGDVLSSVASRRDSLVVSIQLISPASGDLNLPVREQAFSPGFHSTDFPSEWGLAAFAGFSQSLSHLVSIQLISPASGDKNCFRIVVCN